MYTLAVSRHLDARHQLVGGNWGAENERHAHRYRVEIRFEGAHLDRHGYLLDITAVETRLSEVIAALQGSVLNDLPEFSGLNPSIEHLARIICGHFRDIARAAGLSAVAVHIWESDSAWAGFRERL